MVRASTVDFQKCRPFLNFIKFTTNGRRKFDSGTRVSRKPLLLNGEIQYSGQHAEFLVNAVWLELAKDSKPEVCANRLVRAQAAAQVVFNTFRWDV